MVKSHIEIDQAVLVNEVKYISKRIDEIADKQSEQDKKLQDLYLTKEDFLREWGPYKTLITGVIGVIATAITIAVMSLILKK